MSELQIFDNGEFDLHIEPRGDSFTVQAPGLAQGLGFREAHDLVRNLPADETWSEIVRTRSANGVEQSRGIKVVSESGFYRAIGQRNPARIKNHEIRTAVTRFQDWVYREVLPALRKGQQAPSLEPATFTWAETAAIIRQRWGLDLGEATFRRYLRSAGVLKQGMAEPKRQYRDWFWFTGTAWEIHPYAVPLLVRKIDKVIAELRAFRFIQTGLEVEGVGREITGGA